MIDKEQDRFVNFDPVNSRVDILMYETISGKDSKLWNVVRMLLVLSHGQAAVETQQVVERCQNVACSFTRSSSCRNRLFNKQAS